MEKRQDDRDAKKSEDLDTYPKSQDQDQQAADLQVGEERAAEEPSRFAPDVKPESRTDTEAD